jgi:hypothetical protein
LAGSGAAASNLPKIAQSRAAPHQPREAQQHEVAQRIVAVADARIPYAPLAPERAGEPLHQWRICARRLPVAAKAEPQEPPFELRSHVVAAHGADAAARFGLLLHRSLPVWSAGACGRRRRRGKAARGFSGSGRGLPAQAVDLTENIPNTNFCFPAAGFGFRMRYG